MCGDDYSTGHFSSTHCVVPFPLFLVQTLPPWHHHKWDTPAAFLFSHCPAESEGPIIVIITSGHDHPPSSLGLQSS